MRKVKQKDFLQDLKKNIKVSAIANVRTMIRTSMNQIETDLVDEFTEQIEASEATKLYTSQSEQRLQNMLANADIGKRIILIVGGVRYATSLATLQQAPVNSYLYKKINVENFDQELEKSGGTITIDRPNGKYFGYILDLLREGKVHLPGNADDSYAAIKAEAHFFSVALVDDKDDEGDVPRTSGLRFDAFKKHAALQLSNNNQTVTHTGSTGHATIVGTKEMTSGVHTWRVRIDGPDYWYAIGVIEKQNISTQYVSDYSLAWCCGSNGYNNKMTGSAPNLKTNDILTVTLDLNQRKVSVTNVSTGFNMTQTNLPNSTFLPFFNLYSANDKLTLIK